MCGIAGFYGHGNREDIVRMTRALVHRGPDGEGLYVNDRHRVFLGHRRLAVLDIEGGHQPMWDVEQRIGVVFNGEIYNFRELRRELELLGHQFLTQGSDTEVLIHGYRQWGEELLPRLNGMFAFAIYDRSRNRLFMARDRFGEKPLYYSVGQGHFAFASELSALIAHSSTRRDIDQTALQKYFAYGYIPAPHALYVGTAKLPAGHYLFYDLATEQLTIKSFWRFRLQPEDGSRYENEPALIEELRHLLQQATQRRMLSDVPLGLFLSGGLDSSCILAAATKFVPAKDLLSFTIGFTEPSFDESQFARLVADHLGVHSSTRTFDMETLSALTPKVLALMDEPIADPSILPTYLLSGFARQHVTVALSGDGGDELFAGYDPFAALAPARAYQRYVPRPLHIVLRWLSRRGPVSHANMSLDFKLRRALTGLSYDERVWAPVWMAPLEPAEISHLFGRKIPLEELYGDAMAQWEQTHGDDVSRMLEFFTVFYLQDDILTKVDRASMMHSLEARAVFLDNDLVSFCQRLPNRLKFKNGQRKYLLKKSLEGVLPNEIIYRRKKGFGIPVAKWLHSSTPNDPVAIDAPGISISFVNRYWNEHRSGSQDHRIFLWSWLSLQYTLMRQPARISGAA